MKEITLASKVFQRIMHNLHRDVNLKRQKQILSLINSGIHITPPIVREAWKNIKAGIMISICYK